MHTFKKGDRVKVIANHAGHDTNHGTMLTIKQIFPGTVENGKKTMIHVLESNCWFDERDIAKIPIKHKKQGKFIITDLAFIMNPDQFEEIEENHKKYKEPNFEQQQFPLKSTYYEIEEPIIIHYIESTPYGEGNSCEIENGTILCNSKMLCIAENKNEWSKEEYGAIFSTLQEAQDNFQTILNKL